ncbi:hypothetical protein NMG60_11023311 [Bertholletia excelsa]
MTIFFSYWVALAIFSELGYNFDSTNSRQQSNNDIFREKRKRKETETGKLNSPQEPTIHHFSHPYPLHLTSIQTLNQSSCFACELSVSGPTLSLLPTPKYPEGFFNCDACGSHGRGFSFHCKDCNVDLHVLCASMPLNNTHQAHNHELSLTCSPPFFNHFFACDICGGPESKHWLYRCSLCGFGAHMACIPVDFHFTRTGFRRPRFSRAREKQFPGRTSFPSSVPNILGNPITSNRQSSDLIAEAFPNVIRNTSQSAGEQLLQALMGSSGGGGTAQLLQGLNGQLPQALMIGGGFDLSSLLGGNGGLRGMDPRALGGFDFGNLL